MKVMGLEIVKSSTPSIIRNRMKETVKLIINTDESTVQDYISDLRKEFKTFAIEDISFPRGLNGMKEYSHSATLYKKGTPIHVRGAILYNHYIKEHKLENKYQLIQDGEKLKFTYLKLPNPIKEDVISFPSRFPKDLNIEQYVDYDTQFEKCYLEPMKTILESIGWKTEKQNNIESFFA
jgi:hypothetical protein